MSVRFSGWGALAFAHRWLGVAGCLLFILWFASGIAMMYVRMPEVTPAERLGRAAAVDAAALGVTVAEAARIAGITNTGPVQLSMLGGRPVYRFGGQAAVTVFADRAKKLGVVGDADALSSARAYAPEHASRLRQAGLVAVPDQWTLQSRAHLPLHRMVADDAAGTELYVSSRTGEVVMETTRRERVWAYIGPVAHWLYLPVLRRNGPLWTSVIIWSSIAGCVLCVTGLLAGVLRFSPSRRFSMRGGPAMSPYAGWMKWHHCAGLLFGVITLTWTFSGLLSMGPFPLLSSDGATAEQRRALTGAAPGLDAITLDQTAAAVRSAHGALAPKELTLIAFRGRHYWIASESPAKRVLIPAADPQRVVASFDRLELEAVAREAAHGAAIVDITWLDDYDEHYYDRARTRPLPVLRARYGDAEGTWMYLDPGRGAIAMVARRPDRLNRWLYHGLHSLDFAWLYHRRPLWDAVIIGLSLGGVAGAVTSLVPTWRRLHRHVRSFRGLRVPRRDGSGSWSDAPDSF